MVYLEFDQNDLNTEHVKDVQILNGLLKETVKSLLNKTFLRSLNDLNGLLNETVIRIATVYYFKSRSFVCSEDFIVKMIEMI